MRRLLVLALLLGAGCRKKEPPPDPPQAVAEPKETPFATIAEDLPIANVAGPAVVFSSDYRRMAYIATKGGRYVVVVDGQSGDGFKWVGAPVFSFDGAHVAYRADELGRSWIVLDGAKQREHKGAIDPVFLSDGSVAYVGFEESDMKRVWHLVRNGKLGPQHEGNAFGIRIARDGSRVVVGQSIVELKRRPTAGGEYLWSAEGFQMVDCNPEESVSRGYDVMDAPVLSADGRRLAYRAADATWVVGERTARKTDLREFIVLDGEERWKGWDELGTPEFSPDGRRVACPAKKGSKWFLLLDGEQKWDGYDRLFSLAFSPDGSRIAGVAAVGNEMFVVIDGKRGPAFPDVRSLTLGDQTVAYQVRTPVTGAPAIVIGETVHPQTADDLWPPVLVDGGVRFALRRGREIFVRSIRM